MRAQGRGPEVNGRAVNIVLLGPPGAGKGTQAAEVAEQFNVVHVATGDLFRQAIQIGTQAGVQAQAFLDRGELVPDEITIAVVVERLQRPDTNQGVVFDGFPRNVAQATALDSALAPLGKKVDLAINIEVPTKVLVQRLAARRICRSCQAPYHEISRPPSVPGRCDRCGGELYLRDDDRPETVQNRLGVYFRATMPLIAYYQRRGVLRSVNGDQGISEVREELLESVRDVLH